MNDPLGVLAFHYMAANRLPGNIVNICAIYELEALLHSQIELRMQLTSCC
jgi:hypothetical protein